MRSKTLRILPISIIGCIVFCACHSGSPSTAGEDIAVIDFENLPDTMKLTESFDDISCIQLEMTDNSIIGKVKKVIPADSLLIVYSDNDISLFGREDGRFVRNIGSTGEGSEEYIQIQDIFYDKGNNTIVAYDNMTNDFVSYRLDGEFAGKTKAPVNLTGLYAMERGKDGTILATNYISPQSFSPNDCALSVLKSDGKVKELDPYTPIYVGNYVTAGAKHPMSVCEEEIKYVKFLSDTIFSVKNGVLYPLYKLNLGKEIPSKETIAQLGPYGGEALTYSLKTKRLTGIDRIFETSGFIVCIPFLEQAEGTFWIDKESGKGYHAKSSNSNPVSEFMPDVIRMMQGKQIMEIIGADENELICCFNADSDGDIFNMALSEGVEDLALPQKVVNAIKRIDLDGNPFLLIYRHKAE